MADDPSHEPDPSPGRARTWWHPLLVQMLKWAFGEAYEIRDEVSVGELPLRLDVLASRRRGELPEIARRELAPLLPLLNVVTLFEFKSPTDALGPGDLSRFLGCMYLFESQQRPPPARGTLSGVMLAPRMTAPLQENAARLGLTLHERSPGVREIEGAAFPLWVLETDRLSEAGETALTLFSRTFLQDAGPIIDHWRDSGHAEILEFLIQQIEHFKSIGEAFAMQHKDAHVMDQTWEELQAHMLALTPIEKRLEGIPPEQRLEGIPPEQRLEGLSPEELERLRQALEHRLGEKKNGRESS